MSSNLDFVADFDSMELVEQDENTVTVKFSGVAVSKSNGDLKTLSDEVEVEVRRDTLKSIYEDVF